jgi:hypothetical protein
MLAIGAFLIVSILVSFILRLSSERERTRRRGARTPARFVEFTGRRLTISARKAE